MRLAAVPFILACAAKDLGPTAASSPSTPSSQEVVDTALAELMESQVGKLRACYQKYGAPLAVSGSARTEEAAPQGSIDMWYKGELWTLFYDPSVYDHYQALVQKGPVSTVGLLRKYPENPDIRLLMEGQHGILELGGQFDDGRVQVDQYSSRLMLGSEKFDQDTVIRELNALRYNLIFVLRRKLEETDIIHHRKLEPYLVQASMLGEIDEENLDEAVDLMLKLARSLEEHLVKHPDSHLGDVFKRWMTLGQHVESPEANWDANLYSMLLVQAWAAQGDFHGCVDNVLERQSVDPSLNGSFSYELMLNANTASD